MKKTTKKTPSKAKKAAKDLDVKPGKGGAVRGGDLLITKHIDKASP